jgi:hypothetical protein
MEDLPMIPDPFKLEVIKQTGKQYQAVKSQLHRKDISQVIIATDAGREGELVARLILKKAGSRQPIKRLWISSVTDICLKLLSKSDRPSHKAICSDSPATPETAPDHICILKCG